MTSRTHQSWIRRHPVFTLFGLLGCVMIALVFIAEWSLKMKTTLNGKLRVLQSGQSYFVVLREFPPGSHFVMGKMSSENHLKLHNDTTLIYPDSVVVRVDENGFIKPASVHEDPELSIVFLGGSTTLCKMMGEQQRFPYLAAQMLGQKKALKVNGYNAGRSGKDIIFSLNKLLNVVVPMKPEAVVLMHNQNDLVMLLYARSYWSSEVRPKIESFGRVHNHRYTLRYMKPKNGIFPNLRMAVENTVMQYGLPPQHQDEWASVRGKKVDIDTSLVYRDFRSALESFVMTCQSWDILPILMTQQNRITGLEEGSSELHRNLGKQLTDKGISYEEFQSLYVRMNEIIREVAEEHRLLLIDLDKTIPRTSEYMYDLSHFRGCRFGIGG